MRLTKDIKMAIHLESANYCSGNGTTENAPTELLAADLEEMSRPSEGALSIGWVKADHEEKYDLPADNHPNDVHFRGFIAEESKGNFLLQDAIWFDLAIGTTHGEIPDSFDLRIDDGDGEKDLYGCVVTDYELHVELGERIAQSVSWRASQQKISGTTPIIGGIDAFNTTVAPQTYKNLTTLTIDGITINDLKGVDLRLHITNELIDERLQRYLTSDSKSDFILNPIHIKQKVELEFEFTGGDANTWFADLCHGTAQLFNVDIIIGDVLSLSLTNLRVSEYDQTEVAGHGVMPSRVKLVSSKDFAIVRNV